MNLPASLGRSPAARAGGSPTSSRFDALVSEERVVHLVLWFDGERFHALSQEDVGRVRGAARRGGPGGPARRDGLDRQRRRRRRSQALHAGCSRRTPGAEPRPAFDASRERWDRSVEDGLAAPRKAVEDARAAWGKARGGAARPGRAAAARPSRPLERAEREYRRKLDDLRATEAQRYAEKDRAIADLKKRAEPKERRTLVATAYWRCGS